MKRAATKLWKLAKPWRNNSVFAAIALEKLGVQDLFSGLAKAADVLGYSSEEGGILPASFDSSDIVVNEAVCPDLDAASKVERGTAWCRRMRTTCPYLAGSNEDSSYVVCRAASPKERVGAKWYEMGGDQGKLPSSDWGTLSKILSVLGPLAAVAFKRWRSKTLKEELTPQQVDSFSLTKSILDSESIQHSWNTALKRFDVWGSGGKGYVELHDDGVMVIKWKRLKKIPFNKRTDALFDLVDRIKNPMVSGASPYR